MQSYIITLLLDNNSSHFFNSLRTTYFPPAINYISAHLTLFHHLPSTEEGIKNDLQKWSAQTGPLQLNVTAVVSIGKGAAYKIECAELMKLHKAMQQQWMQWLTPQDKQKLWPHITVQNKVSPATAKQTVQTLQASFQPFTAQGLGFALWYYEGGPWRFEREYSFQQ